MTGPRNCSVTLPVEGGSISAACDVARTFATDNALGDDLGARLCIIVEELVANLIDHTPLTPADRFSLQFAAEAGAVTMLLTDPGPPFDPRRAPEPGDLPPERGGGAGLAMVMAWAHIESYTRIGSANRLTLRLTA